MILVTQFTPISVNLARSYTRLSQGRSASSTFLKICLRDQHSPTGHEERICQMRKTFGLAPSSKDVGQREDFRMQMSFWRELNSISLDSTLGSTRGPFSLPLYLFSQSQLLAPLLFYLYSRTPQEVPKSNQEMEYF